MLIQTLVVILKIYLIKHSYIIIYQLKELIILIIMSLIKSYFKKYDEYSNQYGKNTVLLMQVGAFYEMYGILNKKTDSISGSNIREICNLCELSISDKKICIGKDNAVMAGFRDYSLEKYIKKLQSFNYTIVVYSQDEAAAGTTRSLTGIYSPGTYFSNDETKITNNTLCIWFHKYRNKLIIGLSTIDIFTGKSYIFEYETLFSEQYTNFDELERCISVYNPSEVILIYNIDEEIISNVVQYLSLDNKLLHKYNTQTIIDDKKKMINNCENQTYQKQILQKYFNKDYENNEYYFKYEIATKSLCFLLEFIFTHNPYLVSKITEPIFHNCYDKLVLANHSLMQLNMLSNSDNQKKINSVCNFYNRCVTIMGKRKLNNDLVTPTNNITNLQLEYDIVDYILNLNDLDTIRDKLKLIKDIEKLSRKLLLKRITPQDLYFIHENIVQISKLFKTFKKDKTLYNYIKTFINDDITKDGTIVTNIIKTNFDLSVMKNMNTLDLEENFINVGIDLDFDVLVLNWKDSFTKLETIQKYLNSLIAGYEKNKKNKHLDSIKIYKTDKMGYSIIATKRRITLLQEELKKIKTSEINLSYTSYNDSIQTLTLNIENLQFAKSTGANYTIASNEINDYCRKILTTKFEFLEKLKQIYNKVISTLCDNYHKFNKIIYFITLVDVAYNKAYIAKRFNYCKPSIDNSSDKSFFNAVNLRHPLIENILMNELYVSNDIVLDSEQLGILLYGTNAVGKSSLIKSIGISIILAQAGCYVPATSFTYKPYNYLFTRILGNDNLFKGLSTFAVEMLELKTILNQCDENSLILGDELCSGTETNSAISIFLTGIDYLYRKQSSFIFATHFHEIVNYEEIEEKEKLSLKHMTVLYDKSTNLLIYDRKLKDGPGESMYGLEVCKFLKLPTEFLNAAHNLRNKYNKTSRTILSENKSRYNHKKIKGMCELCKKKYGAEVHHLQHQANADEDNFIGEFHKNHPGNLINVCEECHDKLHKNPKGHVRKLTSEGYKLVDR